MSAQFTASTPEDLADRETLPGLSGLEFMQAMLNGSLSPPPMAGLLNFQLDSVEKGRVTFRGTPEFAASNPMGSLHGGWYGTLLDSARRCAVMTMLPKGSSTRRWNTR